MGQRVRTALLWLCLAFAGCINNDIPLPEVELQIMAVEGNGFSVSSIDLAARTVNISLDEKTDIRNVEITRIAATEGATLSSAEGIYDMRTPLYINLSLYQDYLWQIVATQKIEMKLEVEGQIGSARFDTDNCIVEVDVSDKTDLSRLKINALKLGAEEITTYSPTLEELSGTDFSSIRYVEVTCHGRMERWILHAIPTQLKVELSAADAWTRVMWLYGTGIAGEVMGFEYRKAGTEAWTRLSSDDAASGITTSGGSFTARVKVEPLTTYEVRAFCGEDISATVTRTTEEERQLPNAGLELWSQPKAPFLPYASDDAGNPIEPFWGSGNNGSTVLGESYNLTTPVTDLPPGVSGKYSAQLDSRYVVMKLAAGNLFIGEFAGIRSLSHGIVNFGRPFTLRPTALRLWMKYTCGKIDNDKDIAKIPAGENIQVGDYDQGSIFIALGTWTKEEYGGRDNSNDGKPFGTDQCPVSIDTRDTKTFFNPQGKDVVGYGGRIFTESVEVWTQITIPIDYHGITNRVPTHIILACSASRWGDYFTGSRNSTMWVDEIELLYD